MVFSFEVSSFQISVRSFRYTVTSFHYEVISIQFWYYELSCWNSKRDFLLTLIRESECHNCLLVHYNNHHLNMRANFTTWAVVKIRPEKKTKNRKIQACNKPVKWWINNWKSRSVHKDRFHNHVFICSIYSGVFEIKELSSQLAC